MGDLCNQFLHGIWESMFYDSGVHLYIVVPSFAGTVHVLNDNASSLSRNPSLLDLQCCTLLPLLPIKHSAPAQLHFMSCKNILNRF